MSRRPQQYMSALPSVPMSMSVPRAYFLQDDAEFSDGDDAQYVWNDAAGPGGGPPGIHESMLSGTTADVTELYRRKPDDHYLVSQEVVMPDEPHYYYRPAAMSRLPQRRLPVAVTPSTHNATAGQMQGPHPGAYLPPPHEEPRVQYEGMMYRSSPHLQRMAEGRAVSSAGRVMRRPQQLVQDSNGQVGNLVRTVRPPASAKPPVTVPTPRFYRRANLYKRPSTLCLQLPSTPDPARPIKTRLPTTMPGLSIPPLSLRSAHNPHYLTHQPMQRHSALERARTNAMIGEQFEVDERGRRVRRQLTARSAPPLCDDRGKEEDDMERIQRMMMEQRDFGDDTNSNTGDPDPKCSELELLLNQYEQIFNSGPETQDETKPETATGSRKSSTRSRARRKASSARLSGLMKPRLPPSLKNIQKRNSSKLSLKYPSSSADEDRLEIEQMTAEVLDNLLQDLSVGGLAGDAQPRSPSRHSRPSSVKKSESKTVEKSASRIESKTGCKTVSRSQSRGGSINASRAESRVMSAREKREKSGNDVGERCSSKNLSSKKSDHFAFTDLKPTSSFEEIPTKTTFMQDKEKFTKFSNSSHTSFDLEKSNPSQSKGPNSSFGLEEDKDKSLKKDGESSDGKDSGKKSSWTAAKRKVGGHEDHTALELHRSKSYIVNLIDRALSRELGTIPEERSSKQYLNLDARTAMDLISSKNMDTDMCLEITQAIADSLGTVPNKDTANVINSTPCCSTKPPDSARGEPNKPAGELMFSTGTEEPLYIKQLKKLRWGHLKHIQREMRRLEDLERFLDSCSSDK